jgi:hypothetical protein
MSTTARASVKRHAGYTNLLATAAGHGHHAAVLASTDQEVADEARAALDQRQNHDDDSADNKDGSQEGKQTREHEHGAHEH